MPKVGSGIRELRRRRNLSTRELAIRSGVSHSSISLIERDRISPSVNTLIAILDALGTTMTGFFVEVEQANPSSPFYQASDMPEIGKTDGVSYRVIGINHPNRQILMLRETYAVGASSGSPVSHEAQEVGLVTRGAVEVTVGDQSRVLYAGDGYYFDSRQGHTFRNLAETESEIVSAINPPTY